ncbi:MAG TPA: methyltransferase domain-containing protein [Vicinamibacterales bacterium]|jgi:ubiquinone/menaquinone biosynthesis C-methylase UbiE|nr:methyltransferase domain-containing protein [Vicinamibacterales bacterium]
MIEPIKDASDSSIASSTDGFAKWMLDAFNRAGFCLMASIGHRAGLFDVMRDMPPATSAEIAARAGLNERYVREWLGAMTASQVVRVTGLEKPERYTLPAEHAALLTRAAGADNLAGLTQYIALLGSVEDEILECFRNGGGVPYERFPRFHAVMAEDSGQSVIPALETHVLPLVAGLRDALDRGIRVLDVGCGSGRIINRLAELFPRSRFEGRDLSSEAIANATSDARSRNLSNARFLATDLSDFDRSAEPQLFDLVLTFDAIHDQARPLHVLKGIRRTLKNGGVYLMQDIRASSDVGRNIDHPLGTLLYTVSCMHCMTVSLAQGGEGLGAMWGEEKTRDYLQQAGFTSIEVHQLAHDIQNNWYVVR